MERQARVLVVEDDREIATVLRRSLVREGYDVELAADGESALERARFYEPDLVILDLGLPDIDGIDVCKQLRTRASTPILMLTALDDERDIVEGLDLGADDYVTKPFKPNELLARVRALLRRASGPPVRELVIGDLRIDRDGRQVFIGEQPIVLRPREFDLLVVLGIAARDLPPALERLLAAPDEQHLAVADDHPAHADAKLAEEHVRAVWAGGSLPPALQPLL